MLQKLIITLTLILISNVSLADRPKIGLVLSGGGARGAAHIGVLKVLEQQRIPIDFIAGTSMGSIVGGLYASGMTADEIEEVITGLDWNEILRDAPNRQDKKIIRKETEERFSIGGKPGFRDGDITLPIGMIHGQNILPVLQELSHHVAHVNNFNQLPIPFRAVATDIVNGRMVVLKEGSLALSMRASMGVPSVFTPTNIDGVMLVDGGLTNNLPVDVVQRMGADIIIAVDISTPYRTKEELKNLLHITDQMTRILTGVNTIARRAMLREQDILISPQLGDITATDFDRASEAIPLGTEEALKHLDALAQYSLSQTDYEAHIAVRPDVSIANSTIANVYLTNNSGLDDKVLEEYIDVAKGDELNLSKVEADLYDLHSLGNFESVSYRLDHTADGVDLYLDAAAKTWGPNYLYLGIAMEGDLEGDTITNFSLGYSREEVTSKGGVWTTMATLGTEPGLSTHFYLPLSHSLGPFVTLDAGFGRQNQAVFDDDHKLAEYRLKQSEAGAGIGWEFSRKAAVMFGVSRIHGEANLLIGSRNFPQPKYDDGGVTAQFRYDSFNDRDFPSAGSLVNLFARKSYDSFGADEEYEQFEIHMVKVRAFGDHRLGVSIRAGTTNGDPTIAGLFQVGGGPTMLGLKQGQLVGPHMAVAQIYYYKEYTPMPLLSGYIGGLLEYGGVYRDRDEINADNSITSGSIWFAVDTPIGPLQFGIGATDKGDVSYYTRVGHLF